MENVTGSLEHVEDPTGSMQGSQRMREALFLKTGGVGGRLLDNSGILAMEDDEDAGGLASCLGRLQSSPTPVKAVGMDLQMEGFNLCAGSVPDTVVNGDGGPMLGAVVHGEKVGSLACMEIGMNGGGFLNACTCSVHGTRELVGSAAMRMEDAVASSVEKILGSSTVWMADDSPLRTAPVLEPTGTEVEKLSSRPGDVCMDNSNDVSTPCISPVLKPTETEVERLSSVPGEFCMGNNHGMYSGCHSFSAHRIGTQGVRHYASAKAPTTVLAERDHDGNRDGHDSSGNAWQRPSRVALPPVEELGVFSVDGATALLDPAEVDATSQKFQAALVGRLFGRRIPFGVLSGELRRRWAAYGNTRIVTLSGDCFVCFFDKIEARDEALLGGPWVVFGQVLGVDRWTPSFSMRSAVAFSTPVWVRLPALPLYCWSQRNIARIAAVVGQPLWLDGATAELERGAFARVCIRIDLSKPLRSGVWVDGPHGKFFQPLMYEGLSVFCWHCCQVGHKASACRRISPTGAPKDGRSSVPMLDGSCRGSVASQVGIPPLDKAPPGLASLGIDAHPQTAVDKPPAIVDDFAGKGAGPWMVVARKKRSEQVRVNSNKSILGPFHFAGSTGVCLIGSAGLKVARPRSVLPFKNSQQVGSKDLPSIVSKDLQQVGSKELPSIVSKDLPIIGSKMAVESSAHIIASLSNDSECHNFSGFSAQAREDAGRLTSAKAQSRVDKIRGAKKEKMKSDLGPITRGSRKRRKSYSSTDGGDGSPTRPP